MKKIFLLVCAGLTLLSCKEVAKKEIGKRTIPAVAENILDKTTIKLSPALKKNLSALKEDSVKRFLHICEKHPNLLSFIEQHPDFITKWEYIINSKLPEKYYANPEFLKIFLHVDDYARYSGNKIENYILREGKDGIEILNKEASRVFAKIKPGKVVEVVDENINNWFTQLKPLQGCKYIVRKSEYVIDDIGRVSSVDFKINKEVLQKSPVRDQGVQNWMHSLKGSLENDHAGHLIANEFGGGSNMLNLVPMSKNVNLSKFRSLEKQWKSLVQEGKEVKVNIDLKYEGTLERPTWINVKYEYDGQVFMESIQNI